MRKRKERISLLIVFIVVVTISGCDGKKALIMPTDYVKRVLIEEVTGTWCGFCPDGARRMEELIALYPGKVFGAAFHTNDEMEIDAKTSVTDWLGGYTGVPCGAVNRLDTYDTILGDRGYWSSLTTLALNEPAICAIDVNLEVKGSSLSVMIVVGFSQSPTYDVALSVYVIENGITGYPQSNYYNEDTESQFYQAGNPIPDYEHNHVIRAVLTDPEGDTLTSGVPKVDTPYGKSYSFKIPSNSSKSNMAVIAFVHGIEQQVGGKTIFNVQSTEVGGES